VDKLTDARKLAETTKGRIILEHYTNFTLQQFIPIIRQLTPDISEKHLVSVEEETRSVLHEAMVIEGGFLDMVSPVYSKYFTHDEIKDRLAFYRTDLGKKTLRVSPEFNKDFGLIQEQWFKALAPLIQQRVIERLKAEGVELDM
jgi:hypothetical protein